jgi:hypothetical protein
VFLNGCSALLIFLLSRRIMPEILAWVPPVLLTLVPAPMHKSFFIFVPLVSLYLAALYLEKKIGTFRFGVAVGLTILFRQDSGLVGVLVGLSAIVLMRVWDRKNWGRIFEQGFRFCLGVIVAILPFVVYFAVHSGMDELLSQLIFSGLRAQRGKAVPFPDMRLLIRNIADGRSLFLLILYYLPLVIYAWSLLFIIYRFMVRRMTESVRLHTLILFTAFLILPQALTRSEPEHMTQILPPFYLLFSYWIWQFYEWARGNSRFLMVRLANLVLCLALSCVVLWSGICLIFFVQNTRSPFFTVFSNEYELLDHPRARVFVSKKQHQALDPILEFFKTHAAPEDYLVCMPYASLFNFLTGLRNPTRHDIFLPGEMTGSHKQQQEIIRSMQNPRLRYAILDERPFDGLEQMRMEYYMPEVHKFIMKNFRPAKRISPYLILARIDSVQ